MEDADGLEMGAGGGVAGFRAGAAAVPVYERYSRSMNFNPGSLGFLLALVLAGPGLLAHSGLWQVPIEGAATAAVLCLVDWAFDWPDEPGGAKPTSP